MVSCDLSVGCSFVSGYYEPKAKERADTDIEYSGCAAGVEERSGVSVPTGALRVLRVRTAERAGSNARLAEIRVAPGWFCPIWTLRLLPAVTSLGSPVTDGGTPQAPTCGHRRSLPGNDHSACSARRHPASFHPRHASGKTSDTPRTGHYGPARTANLPCWNSSTTRQLEIPNTHTIQYVVGLRS